MADYYTQPYQKKKKSSLKVSGNAPTGTFSTGGINVPKSNYNLSDLSVIPFSGNTNTANYGGAGIYAQPPKEDNKIDSPIVEDKTMAEKNILSGSPTTITDTNKEITPSKNVKDKPISLDTLGSTETLMEVPEKTQLNYPTFSLAEDTQAEITDIEKKRQSEVSSIENLINQIGSESGQEQTYYEKEGGVVSEKNYNQYVKELKEEQLNLEKNIDNIIRNNPTGALRGGQLDMIENMKRESLLKQASLSIKAEYERGNIDSARENAQNKVKMKLLPLQSELDARKFIYDSNKSLFDKASSAKIDSLLQMEQNRIDKIKREQETIEDMKLSALENGAPASAVTGEFTSLNEAINKFGKYLNKPDRQLVNLPDGSTVLFDKKSGKIVSTLGGTTGGNVAANFESVINQVSSFGATNQERANIKSNMTNYLNNQDYVSAYKQIENSVEGNLTGTTKTKFADSKIDSTILKGLREKIVEFDNAGGDTGLLKGTEEQITRKLGQVKDPKLTSLAVALQREFQNYRLNMTGAAFSPKESRDYASVNPKTTNTFDLNLAVIDGAISALDNRVNGTVDTYVSSAKDVRALAQAPSQYKQEVDSNPFLQAVETAKGQVYNDNTGWIIPTN